MERVLKLLSGNVCTSLLELWFIVGVFCAAIIVGAIAAIIGLLAGY